MMEELAEVLRNALLVVFAKVNQDICFTELRLVRPSCETLNRIGTLNGRKNLCDCFLSSLDVFEAYDANGTVTVWIEWCCKHCLPRLLGLIESEFPEFSHALWGTAARKIYKMRRTRRTSILIMGDVRLFLRTATSYRSLPSRFLASP